MMLNKSKIALMVAGVSLSSVANGKTLVWEDNFNQVTIDRSVWTFDVGNSGWGNGELQTYTDDLENAYIEDGALIIRAMQDEGGNFTSARLKTQGLMSYQYGTIEARIKLPDLDAGLWPAFWQLGGNYGQVGWPYCGELDILEAGMAAAQVEGNVNAQVSGAFHWWHESEGYTGKASHGLTKNLFDDLASATDLQDYHVYGMTWTPDSIKMWVDDERNEVISIGTDDPAFDEFRQQHFILLNMAVGGVFPEIYNNAEITAPIPAKMYVDYVRIYDNDADDYTTSIQFSDDTAKSGDLGIYSERDGIVEHLELGADLDLNVWNNLAVSHDTVPAEGSDVLNLHVGANDWYGMGFATHQDVNMMQYQNGYLHLQMKTTHSGVIGIGIGSTSGGESWLDLNDGDYNVIRDGEWHEVNLPLGLFSVDFNTISQIFMLKGETGGAGFELAIDDIYFSESIDKATPTEKFVLYSETLDSDNTFTLGIDGELYIWDNTLMTSTASPFEGNNGLSYSSAGTGWFGLGFAASAYYDLSAYDNTESYLNFALKTTDSAAFSIGMKSGSISDVGQKWIAFDGVTDPYDFIRDGEWHEVSIPMTDFSSEVDLSNVIQLFELLGTGEISNIEIDHIYFSDGQTGDEGGSEEENTVDLIPQASMSASTEMLPANDAIDGNRGTRWESMHGIDPAWLTLDLGEPEQLSHIRIEWETANAARYMVQGSNDNNQWTTLVSIEGAATGERTDELSLSGHYRYVRIYGTARNTDYGYSIWEIGLSGDNLETVSN